MKKLMMMALFAIMTTATFAQDAAKQILKMKNYDEAAALLNNNLGSMDAETKAKCYNKLVDLCFNAMKDEMDAPEKSESFYTALNNAFEAAKKCYEFDVMPNEKGKVKPKFIENNGMRLFQIRHHLINGGIMYQGKNDNVNAYKFLKGYVDSAEEPLFAKFMALGDQNLTNIAYYAAIYAYQNKDMANAEKYAEIAMNDPEKSREALNIKLALAQEQLKTREDSVAYAQKLEQIYASDKTNKDVFGTLINTYIGLGMDTELEALLEAKLAEEPDNFTVWAVRGQRAMSSMKLDEAVGFFKKALDIQPENVTILTYIGACQLDRAALAEDRASGKTGRAPKAAMEQIRPIYDEARGYLEKARLIDPERKEANWAYPLYRVYYSLKDEAKMKELEPLVNQ